MTSISRILSIQSHVVSGYVGNKSSVFPLQLHGFEVDFINSVQFSNHTGYVKGLKGHVLNSDQLWELIQGLETNDLSKYSHLITGYVGDQSFLIKIAQVVQFLKSKNPKLKYVCDPVIGDTGPGIYVPKELIPIYKDTILPLADICLPNQFELEILTNSKIIDEKTAYEAMDKLMSKGVNIVILSSSEIYDGYLTVLASTPNCTAKASVPVIPARFVGSGDLFTSLCVAWLEKTNGDLESTLQNVLSSMKAVLTRTYDSAEGQYDNPAKMELKIIQSIKDIQTPSEEKIEISTFMKNHR